MCTSPGTHSAKGDATSQVQRILRCEAAVNTSGSVVWPGLSGFTTREVVTVCRNSDMSSEQGEIMPLPVKGVDNPPMKEFGEPYVWVFNGTTARFASAVFTTKEKAERWIAEHGLSGTLTAYPLDISVYDWVIKHDFWAPKRDDQKTADAIANFHSAYTDHDHYEDGAP